MTYQVTDAKTGKQIAAGLSLQEAHRFVRDRRGCYYHPGR